MSGRSSLSFLPLGALVALALVGCGGSPVVTAEATALPSPSPSAAPTIAPTGTPVAWLPGDAGGGRLFGPFNIAPTEVDDWPFSVSRYVFDPLELDAARSSGIHILIALTGGRSRYTDSGGCFDLAAWQAAFDRWDAALIRPYVDDGTIVGLYAMDEPHDWGAPCGPTVVELNAACRHVHRALPDLACGFNAPFEWLEQGLDETDFDELDYLFTQYSIRQGDVHRWVENQLEHARWFDGDIWFSINVVTGNPTPEQVREAGSVLCRSDAVGVLMWEWGARFEEPGMREAVEAIAAMCAVTE